MRHGTSRATQWPALAAFVVRATVGPGRLTLEGQERAAAAAPGLTRMAREAGGLSYLDPGRPPGSGASMVTQRLG